MGLALGRVEMENITTENGNLGSRMAREFSCGKMETAMKATLGSF